MRSVRLTSSGPDAILRETQRVRSRSLAVGFLWRAAEARRSDRLGRGVPSPAADRPFGLMALQAIILNKAMSLIVVATALPARLLGVPLEDSWRRCT